MKRWLLACLFPVLAAMVAGQAWACSCAGPESVGEAYRQAGVVVVAEAVLATVRAGTPETGDPAGSPREHQTVRWRVTRHWKGPHAVGQEFQTTSLITCCMCGVRVEKQEVYVLYLSGTEPYDLGICGRSGALELRKSDVPALDRLKNVGSRK